MPLEFNIFMFFSSDLLESALLGSIGMLISIGIIGVPFIDNLVGVIFLGMCIQAGSKDGRLCIGRHE